MTSYGELVSKSGSDSCAQSAAILVAAVLKDVNVQSLALTDRRRAYEVMQWAASNPELPGEVMCAGFARGFAQCMDGERDPRNLMLCFSIIPSILSGFVTTQEEADALFSAASCYFPITFTPPPNDTVGITTAMLRDALLACLTADRRFCGRAPARCLRRHLRRHCTTCYRLARRRPPAQRSVNRRFCGRTPARSPRRH